MVQFFLVLVMVSMIHCKIVKHKEQNLIWYSSTSVENFPNSKVDFRGCYESECAYVSNVPLHQGDRIIGSFHPSQKLWVLRQNSTSMLTWVFSSQKPEETPTTLWISHVPEFRVLPSYFDATPYFITDPDPLVAQVVESISEENIRNSVELLANGFFTRNSFSNEAVEAAHFLAEKMTELGCQSARLQEFRSGYSPNIICELPGFDSETPIVVVGAHYDSRGTGANNPNERAPGADDNGTGTSGLLEVIRVAAELINEGILFRRKIIFVLFSGEEQGLFGSAAIATEYKGSDVQIAGMVNLDMIGFPEQNRPSTLWWKNSYVNRNLTDLGITLTKTYLGESTTIATSVSCCSDFRSFTEQGYPATGVFESTSGNNNPNYHRPSDLPSTVTYSHARRTTQMAAALIVTISEPRGPDFVKFFQENRLMKFSELEKKWIQNLT